MSITVTTTSNAINGDVATVAGLLASPGPDGISLLEAIDATNNDPGTYTIRFDRALRGKILTLSRDLLLSGGGVTLTGDSDGNGDPDVTLRPRSTSVKSQGFTINSSHNRLRSLTLRGFTIGGVIAPSSEGQGQPILDNVVSGLVLRDIATDGIIVGTDHRMANITITGNTIDSVYSGIAMGFEGTKGARLEDVTVTDNRIRYGKRAKHLLAIIGIHLIQSGNGTGNLISDVVIARNSLEGSNGDGGIVAVAGAHRARANTIQRLRILDNEIRLVRRGPGCCQGITVQAGCERPELIFPNVKPLRYPDANVVRNVEVRGNTVSGTFDWGVLLCAGAFGAGGSYNRVEDAVVARNVIRSSTVGFGVYAKLGHGRPYKRRYATGNRITDLTIDANRITIQNRGGWPAENPGGIVFEAGGTFSRNGVIRNARITRNRIATRQPGIRLIGGFSPTSRENRVVCVRLARNVITRTSKRVSVTPNLLGASGNRVSLGGC